MSDRESTARSRELGKELHDRRLEFGITATELGMMLGWSPSKVSRVEAGLTGLTEVDLVHYLARCGAPYKDVNTLLELCREVRSGAGCWVRPLGMSRIPDMLKSLIYHESRAIASTSYESELIPGLVQTEEYARVTVGRKPCPPDAVEALVRARMERQSILRRSPKGAHFTFFIHQRSLIMRVGGNRIMNEQLLNLLFFAMQPHVDIRVVPGHIEERSVFGGPFRLLRFIDHQPLVYLDGPGLGMFLEDDEYVASYRELITEIGTIALDRGQSRELIAILANNYDRAECQGDVGEYVEEEQL